MKKDEIYKEINDNKFLFVGGLLFFIILLGYSDIVERFYSDNACEIKDGVCVISSIIPTIKTLFVFFIIFVFWYMIMSTLVLPFLDNWKSEEDHNEGTFEKLYGKKEK